MLVDKTAALRSASWGKFQVVAMNYKLAGKPDLASFISAMFQSEGAQLDAFCAFVTSKGLVKALRSHDWASFALGYNGPEYYKKHYDRRMHEEYNRARGGAVHATTH
jgi:N-acetylmuramidase